jgi:hypothetical protein
VLRHRRLGLEAVVPPWSEPGGSEVLCFFFAGGWRGGGGGVEGDGLYPKT